MQGGGSRRGGRPMIIQAGAEGKNALGKNSHGGEKKGPTWHPAFLSHEVLGEGGGESCRGMDEIPKQGKMQKKKIRS